MNGSKRTLSVVQHEFASMVACGVSMPLEVAVADQPTKAMTLREAVEIDRRLTYTNGELSCSDDTGLSDLEYEVRDRARAIVDAAVEAHEARLALEAFPGDPADTGFDWHTEPLWEASKNADDKLRALERGEETP